MREHRIDAEQLRRDVRRVAADVEQARDRISQPVYAGRCAVRTMAPAPTITMGRGMAASGQACRSAGHERWNTGSMTAHHSPGGASDAGSCSDFIRRSHSWTRGSEARCLANTRRKSSPSFNSTHHHEPASQQVNVHAD